MPIGGIAYGCVVNKVVTVPLMHFFTLLSLLAAVSACSFAALQITLNHTTVIGHDVDFSGFHQEFFGSIPFGFAPRFSRPLPRSLSGSTLNATEYGVLCAQAAPPDHATAEDCLNINILRPAGDTGRTHSGLPVLVWIYGGGFQQSLAYNGSIIVANSVKRGTPLIYVSFQYRLGPFGFPQGAEAARYGALNLGLRDQILALEWIQANIGAFGGDPSKVTLFGESAGAQSIALLYLNAGLENLARGTIMESSAQASIPISNATLRTPAWQTFFDATPECAGTAFQNSFDCLRNASLPSLLAAWGVANLTTFQYPFTPVLDGPGGLIPESPGVMLTAGRFARVPFITGANLDEGTGAIPPDFDYSNEPVVLSLLYQLNKPYTTTFSPEYQDAVKHLVSLYPTDPAAGSPFGTGNDTFGFDPLYKRYAALLGDFQFQAPRRAWQQAATKFGVKTYGYLFADQDAVLPGFPEAGVAHGSELAYVYGSTLLDGTPAQINTGLVMMDYWASFVTSLDPNDGRGSVPKAHWESYDLRDPAILEISRNATMVADNYRAVPIDYINARPLTFVH